MDIYSNRVDIVSPGSWLLPKSYDAYPAGAIPSIRRNSIIAACLDVANLMERGGTGFQTMINSYRDSDDHLQPVISIYPGFLDLRLFDRLYEPMAQAWDREQMTDTEKIVQFLREEGPGSAKELQAHVGYSQRNRFLKEVINPMIRSGIIYRDGNNKSPTARICLREGESIPGYDEG